MMAFIHNYLTIVGHQVGDLVFPDKTLHHGYVQGSVSFVLTGADETAWLV